MMRETRRTAVLLIAALVALGGCASRPVNPPLTHADHAAGYRFQTRQHLLRDHDNLIVLAFSGGGTRAAAFSYGVLEALRRLEVVDAKGSKIRMLDEVGVIAGVSGGSFTALSYGLYGDKLFDQYEQRFLKRDVEGELIARALNPFYWGPLLSPDWGRSELAADLYDEILFNGATFAELQRGSGPMIVATATDVSSGARFYYTQTMFDILCSDLAAVRLSRAAASSSAVPVVLSPVTINNYGGTCGFREPPFLKLITNPDHPIRPAARTLQELADLRAYQDSGERPYIHLVDGGVADNLAMRGVIDIMDEVEAVHLVGLPTPLDGIKRIAVIVVNSRAAPRTDWDKRASAPGTFAILMQASGVPIDHYSYEAVELLRDTAARWKMLRGIRDSGAITDKSNPALVDVMRVPNTELYVVNISFAELGDAPEREYLNSLPTSFVLPAEAVDRLRAAAGTILVDSPEFKRFLKDAGQRVVPAP
jgi:NTE family protein